MPKKLKEEEEKIDSDQDTDENEEDLENEDDFGDDFDEPDDEENEFEILSDEHIEQLLNDEEYIEKSILDIISECQKSLNLIIKSVQLNFTSRSKNNQGGRLPKAMESDLDKINYLNNEFSLFLKTLTKSDEENDSDFTRAFLIYFLTDFIDTKKTDMDLIESSEDKLLDPGYFLNSFETALSHGRFEFYSKYRKSFYLDDIEDNEMSEETDEESEVETDDEEQDDIEDNEDEIFQDLSIFKETEDEKEIQNQNLIENSYKSFVNTCSMIKTFLIKNKMDAQNIKTFKPKYQFYFSLTHKLSICLKEAFDIIQNNLHDASKIQLSRAQLFYMIKSFDHFSKKLSDGENTNFLITIVRFLETILTVLEIENLWDLYDNFRTTEEEKLLPNESLDDSDEEEQELDDIEISNEEEEQSNEKRKIVKAKRNSKK